MVFFGGFDGSRILDSIDGSFPLVLESSMLKDPSLRIENNKVLIKRDPAVKEVSLGDMRVWYDVVPATDYTVVAKQVDEVFLLDAAHQGPLLIRLGIGLEALRRSLRPQSQDRRQGHASGGSDQHRSLCGDHGDLHDLVVDRVGSA